MKRSNIQSFQPTLWLSSVVDVSAICFEFKIQQHYILHNIVHLVFFSLSSSAPSNLSCLHDSKPFFVTTCPIFLSLQALINPTRLQLMKATVLAESSIYFIFSPDSLHSSNVFRYESGRCRSLPFVLRFFYNFTFLGFPYILIYIYTSIQRSSLTNLRHFIF